MSNDDTWHAAHYLIGFFRGFAFDRSPTWVKRTSKTSWLSTTKALATAEKLLKNGGVDNPLEIYEMQSVAELLGFGKDNQTAHWKIIEAVAGQNAPPTFGLRS